MLKTHKIIFISLAPLLLSGILSADSFFSVEEEKKLQEQFAKSAQEAGSIMFTPPADWHLADPKSLPPSVKVMVVGKGEKEFPPSLNLGSEEYSGTLKQYLKRIKNINESQGAEWKDLGAIRTEAGEASLSQVDFKSKWGEVHMMHVVLLKEGTVYILTAAALKEEFPKYYKDFFNSLRSLRFNESKNENVKTG